MKNIQIVYMDGYDEVRNLETGEVIFSTKIPQRIEKYVDRTIIDPNVIDEVVHIWNKSNNLELVDEYLLDEGLCTQEERELIIESLYKYIFITNS